MFLQIKHLGCNWLSQKCGVISIRNSSSNVMVWDVEGGEQDIERSCVMYAMLHVLLESDNRFQSGDDNDKVKCGSFYSGSSFDGLRYNDDKERAKAL